MQNIMNPLKPSAYIRFLNLIDKLDHINPVKSLDSIELQLLNAVLLAAYSDQPLLVGDLIHLSQLGSQATLHGRIKNLVAMGYIKLETHQEDARKKYVIPTKLVGKYVSFMSNCLTKAMR